MATERVRIALDVAMDDDPDTQNALALHLASALIDAANSFGVDLDRSSCVIVTKSGGATERTEITSG